METTPPLTKDEQERLLNEAEEFGIDLSLCIENLRLSPTERAYQNEGASAFVREIQGPYNASGKRKRDAEHLDSPHIRFRLFLESLHREGVAYVIIGGLAASLRGSAYVTHDLDVCYDRNSENIKRLVRALEPLNPRLRVGREPEGVPFLWDEKILSEGLNFTLTTDIGAIDLLGEVPGLGDFEHVQVQSTAMDVFGYGTHVLDLEALITTKELAGRTKDQLLLPELRALLALREKGDG